MSDKFIKGVIAGGIAGLIKDTFDFLFHHYQLFVITDHSFWDYANIIASGRHPQGLFEQLYALFFEVIFSMLLGIIYVLIIPYLKTKYNFIRGAIYGGIVWFGIRAWVTAFQIHPLQHETGVTIFVNSILSILFGIVLESIIQIFEKKEAAE